MNWLVTGGCGFIGVNLVRALKGRGDYVRVLDDLSAGSREDLDAVTESTDYKSGVGPRPGRVELMVGDIRDGRTACEAVQGVDAVVHLAAQTAVMQSVEDPKADCETNVLGTLSMLEAVRLAGVKRFVFASSAAPLGDQDPPADETRVPRPLSPYGASKLAGEGYCSAYHGSYGVGTVSLRFSNAYGPYSFKKGSVMALFFRRALSGEPLVVYGDGGQTRDFVHTEDLCQAIIKGAESGAGGEVFQVGTGRETAVRELAQKVGALVKRDLGREVEVLYEPARKGDIQRSVSDITKAGRSLGFAPGVGLDEGLEETWAWFKGRVG